MLKKLIKHKETKHNHSHDASHDHGHDHGNMIINKWFWIKSITLGLLFLYFVVINIVKPEGPIKYTWHWGIWFPLTTYVVFWEGRKYLKIYKRLFKFMFDMDTLIGLASHILYLFSIVMVIVNWDKPMYSYPQMWEGTTVLIVITNIGHVLEDKVKSSSLKAYEKLNEMKNAIAHLVKNGKIIEVKSKDIKVGDIIMIKKGELVPLDGKTLEAGSFDYSNITGESNIIEINKNQDVISGSYNVGDSIQVRITKDSKNSTINAIVESIQLVSMNRPKMQKFADKILKFFVPTILSLSFLTFLIWIIIGYTTGYSVSWINNDDPIYFVAIEAGVTVMAIACPCALGIATPLVYTVSSLLSSENRILINDPKSFEELSRIKIVAFDKTGTITNEKLEIESIEGNKSLLPVAIALEATVKHPIANSILKLGNEFAKVTSIKSIDNKGVEGKWKNKKVEMKKYNDSSASTNVALYVDEKPELIFKFKNTIKKGVKETISKLHKQGFKTIMITGDNKSIANKIAQDVGIDQVYAEVTPNQKSEIIQKIQEEGKVAFVGDGFNDSIAMKKANVSIAFSSGSDITNSLSDISLIRNDFTLLSKLTKLGKMNNKWVKIALTYAFTFNVITIPIAMLLLVQPWVGASIMAISDILVALNAYMYKIIGRKKLNKK